MTTLQRLSLLFFIACSVFSADSCRPFWKRSAERCYDDGIAKRNEGDTAGAMADFTEAIKTEPKLAPPYLERGLLKVKLKDYVGAVADYDSVLQLRPQDVQTYRRRGLVKLFEREDLDGALADFEQVIQLAPSWAPGYQGRALVKERRNDLAGATADLNRAVQLDPNSWEVEVIKVRLMRKLGDLKGALNVITRAIQARPQVAHFYRERFQTELLLQDWEGVISDNMRFLEVSLVDRDYANLFLWVGRVHLGQIKAANQQLSEYLQSVPSEPIYEWTNTIAKFLLDKISEDDLLKASEKGEAVTQKGQRCEAWYYAGVKKLAAGDTKAAKERFQKCVDTKMDAFAEYDAATVELKVLAASH